MFLLVIFVLGNTDATISISVFMSAMADFELCVDEPEEEFVDNPADVPWLAELLHGAFLNGALALPSSYWAG